MRIVGSPIGLELQTQAPRNARAQQVDIQIADTAGRLPVQGREPLRHPAHTRLPPVSAHRAVTDTDLIAREQTAHAGRRWRAP